MKLNLKALGLALVAALAISAVAASTAGAEGPAKFTAEKYPVALTGTEEGETGDNYFQITGESGPSTHCENVTYEGTAEEANSTITITPHYTNCVATTSIGTINATVDVNECYFEFTAGKTTAGGAAGTASVICPGEPATPTHDFITVTTAFCDTHVPEQTIGANGGIEFTNTAEGDVTVDVDITEELTYIETKTSIFGPCTNNHHTSNGTFVAEVTVEGFEDKGTHHWTTVNANGTEITKETLTEGAALDIDVG